MTFDLNRLFDPSAISEETADFNAKFESELAKLPQVHKVDPVLTRQARAEGRGIFPSGGPLEGSTWQEIPGAEGGTGRVRISEPDGPPKGIYLHIHGGGWTIGAPDQYDRFNQEIARTAGVRVVSVQYRLAPEHPWPAQQLDCMAAARWVIDTTDLPVVIGGESAGGHLSATTALGLREEEKLTRIRGLALTYGCFDLRMTPSMATWGERYLVLSTPIVDWFTENTDPGGKHRGTPEMSPLLADLAKMPPALFQVGTFDPLLDDTLFMAQRWRAAGNQARLAVYPGGIHAFDMFEITIAKQCRAAVIDFIKTSIAH